MREKNLNRTHCSQWTITRPLIANEYIVQCLKTVSHVNQFTVICYFKFFDIKSLFSHKISIQQHALTKVWAVRAVSFI